MTCHRIRCLLLGSAASQTLSCVWPGWWHLFKTFSSGIFSTIAWGFWCLDGSWWHFLTCLLFSFITSWAPIGPNSVLTHSRWDHPGSWFHIPSADHFWSGLLFDVPKLKLKAQQRDVARNHSVSLFDIMATPRKMLLKSPSVGLRKTSAPF